MSLQSDHIIKPFALRILRLYIEKMTPNPKTFLTFAAYISFEGMARILIVEDDLTFLTMLRTWLGKKGFVVETAGRVAAARALLDCGKGRGTDGSGFDLVLSDMRLPDDDGLRLLEWLRGRGDGVPFIVMTSYAEVQNAVLAMKAGADDYIAKPLQPDILLSKINDALAKQRSAPAASAAKTASSASATVSSVTSSAASRPDSFIEGTSDAAQRLYGYVGLVAPTPMSVLILGASGTGKEYVARRIHAMSRRCGGPFVAIDCGAIPRDVAESELFGHVKGAFTGAVADRRGAFAAAEGGTLFLDEVGNLSYDIQVRLLRALQEHRIRPVGATEETAVDFRLVCATNENLAAAVAAGTFREDLYHRINEFTIQMPALRERGADLYLFADLFLREANRELDLSLSGFAPDASALLARHTWPGNLRELKNVVRRAALLAQSDVVGRQHLEQAMTAMAVPSHDSSAPIAAPSTPTPVAPLHNAGTEAEQIRHALQTTNGNKSLAARMLGIDRKTLYNKLEKYGISI